jgi:hypothetical protein
LITVLGSRKVHIANVGRAVKTALVSSNLPASERKKEKATSLLSHLETKGQKSATVGLVRLRDSDLAQSLYSHAGMNFVVILFMYCVMDMDNVVALYCLLGLAFFSHDTFFILVRI